MTNQLKTCPCGRSPTGRCQGWHALDSDEYLEYLSEFIEDMEDEPEHEALVEFQNKKIEEITK